MLRHYYITLSGEYINRYADIYTDNAENAYSKAVVKFGVMNVGNVYTEKAWARKYTKSFRYLCEVGREDREQYLRSRKII